MSDAVAVLATAALQLTPPLISESERSAFAACREARVDDAQASCPAVDPVLDRLESMEETPDFGLDWTRDPVDVEGELVWRGLARLAAGDRAGAAIDLAAPLRWANQGRGGSRGINSQQTLLHMGEYAASELAQHWVGPVPLVLDAALSTPPPSPEDQAESLLATCEVELLAYTRRTARVLDLPSGGGWGRPVLAPVWMVTGQLTRLALEPFAAVAGRQCGVHYAGLVDAAVPAPVELTVLDRLNPMLGHLESEWSYLWTDGLGNYEVARQDYEAAREAARVALLGG